MPGIHKVLNMREYEWFALYKLSSIYRYIGVFKILPNI